MADSFGYGISFECEGLSDSCVAVMWSAVVALGVRRSGRLSGGSAVSEVVTEYLYVACGAVSTVVSLCPAVGLDRLYGAV